MNPVLKSLSTLIGCVAASTLTATTEIVYLSGTDSAHTVTWEFYCTDGRKSGEWSTIEVPSNWELQGYGTYNYGHDWRNESMVLGKERGIYRHRFEVPEAWVDKVVRIVFEGSMTDTTVKINGDLAGPVHQGSFYRFHHDITELLRFGAENELEVEVAKHSANDSVNQAERQADYWIFGGIFRPVYLEVLPRSHIQRAAIDARADGSLHTRIECSTDSAGHTVVLELTDLDGNAVGSPLRATVPAESNAVEIVGTFAGIQPWNPEWPHRYDLKVSLLDDGKIVHTRTERIGFRTVELRPHDGFYVNGTKVVFKGVNRHSFWPTTGRALSLEQIEMDIQLIKAMNMNAVRMSHYPPDKAFLELCDAHGLFVLNEVAGWQDGYDTEVGPRVIRETVLRDENHPSVVIWCNGNEGGWDFANEPEFHRYDIQKRPVLYPWLLRNGMDLHHYPSIQYATAKYHNGNDPFMPTEFLHGLYDGGHGAGLEDYWNQYRSSPLHAGGFLWVFSDEAVLRTDREGRVHDSDGHHAPDGILGPYREIGGSFFTIKEIWSPVQVEPLVVNRQWNGRLFLSNQFLYTNLNQCRFAWQMIQTGFGEREERIVAQGSIAGPEAIPGETAALTLPVTQGLPEADLFRLTARDPKGAELFTWSWPVLQTWEVTDALLEELKRIAEPQLQVVDQSEAVQVSTSALTVRFSKADGSLLSIQNGNGNLSFTGGPRIVGADLKVTGTEWGLEDDGDFRFTVQTDHPKRTLVWTFHRDGMLHLEADLLNNYWGEFDYFGLTFDYPEAKCTGAQWMGRGPYRVWKNRLKGSTIGVWEKAYNNTITGESFDNLLYPEFKGYHANLHWVVIQTTESPITILSETPNLYLHLFTPDPPEHQMGGTSPPFPGGDISFLYEIPPIGTKFKQPDQLGLRSQRGWHGGHRGEQTYPIKLWFDFRGK